MRFEISFTRSRKASSVKKSRESYALFSCAAGIRNPKALNLLVISGEGERAILQLRQVYVVSDHLTGSRSVARSQQIAPPEFVRSQSHSLGNLIHVPLYGKQALRRAEAAKSAVRGCVGGDGNAAHAHVIASVGSSCVNRAARKHDWRQGRVSASIDRKLDLHREQSSVASPLPSGAASATDAVS